MKIFKLNKKEIITIIFILFCLFGYVYFPVDGAFQYKVAAIIFLMVTPFLYCKYFLREDIFFKKISIGDWKKNVLWLLICLFLALLIMFVFFKYTDLQKHYFLPAGVKQDFWRFLKYELTGILFIVALYELFFRGFILFHFKLIIDKWSILMQLLFFIGMISLIGLPYWFYVLYLVFSPFAGWLAYKSESLVYSFLGQLFFIIIVDAAFIATYAK